MNLGLYTSKSKTVGKTVKKDDNILAKDILNPQNKICLEDSVDFVHMILSKNFNDDEFSLNGFYRFGIKQDPIDVSIYDIIDNSTLKIENREAVKLLNGYIKKFYNGKPYF